MHKCNGKVMLYFEDEVGVKTELSMFNHTIYGKTEGKELIISIRKQR